MAGRSTCRSDGNRQTTIDRTTKKEHNKNKMEVPMTKTNDVVERALATVSANRAWAEREAKRRDEAFGKIQLATMKIPSVARRPRSGSELH